MPTCCFIWVLLPNEHLFLFRFVLGLYTCRSATELFIWLPFQPPCLLFVGAGTRTATVSGRRFGQMDNYLPMDFWTEQRALTTSIPCELPVLYNLQFLNLYGY